VYRVVYSRQARAQADGLPSAGRRALAEAVEELGRDPSLGQRAQGTYPSSAPWRLAGGAWSSTWSGSATGRSCCLTSSGPARDCRSWDDVPASLSTVAGHGGSRLEK
jgi:hypothetical protein